MKPEIHTVKNVLVVGQPGYDRLTETRADRYRAAGYVAELLPTNNLIPAGGQVALEEGILDFLEAFDDRIRSDRMDGVIVVNAKEPRGGGRYLPVGAVGRSALLLAYSAGRRRFLSDFLPDDQLSSDPLDSKLIKALDPIPLKGAVDLREAIWQHDKELA